MNRFWSKVRVCAPNECWPWTAYARGGYGRFMLHGKSWIASRAAWLFTCGDPGGLDVCHSCDNPACCNPRHLYLGTHTQNMKDRGRRGPVKLARPCRSAIRCLLKTGRYSQTQVARLFGITQNYVSLIERQVHIA